eukprot:PLAT2470.4.p1 GENE.PLAT2470.4~~PLAT2470.4.p1  ORF type:complete len:355 (+),score=135.32 PLAT2470.4:100-1164(+)
MSSLAAAQADSYYRPPDWRPEHGSLNKRAGLHPLGKRARKIGQGILVVRLELPFNCVCTSCDTPHAKGSRFNAEKKRSGSYHSTSIWTFSMKCPNCSALLQLRTEPKLRDYVCQASLRRRVLPTDSAVPLDGEERKQEREEDPFAAVEAAEADAAAAAAAAPALRALHARQRATFGRVETLGAALRASARKKRKAAAALAKRAAAHGLSLSLLPKETADSAAAAAAVSSKHARSVKHAQAKAAAAARAEARRQTLLSSKSMFERSHRRELRVLKKRLASAALLSAEGVTLGVRKAAGVEKESQAEATGSAVLIRPRRKKRKTGVRREAAEKKSALDALSTIYSKSDEESEEGSE